MRGSTLSRRRPSSSSSTTSTPSWTPWRRAGGGGIRRRRLARRPVVERLHGAVGVEDAGLGRGLLAGEVALAAVDFHPGARARQPELVDRPVRRIPPLLGDVLPAAVVVPRHGGDVTAERRPRRRPAAAPASTR